MAEPQVPFDLDFNPYSLPPDFLVAIGLVTTAAAQTEDMIEGLIVGCLGIDSEYGMAVTTHMAMPQRFSVLRSAAEIRIDDLDVLDELDGLIDRVDKAFERRNSVVHHQWGIEPATERVFVVKESARSRVETDVVEMTLEAIHEIALEVYEAGMAIFVFTKEHGLFPPDPPIPRPRGHKSRAERKKRRKARLHADEINRKAKPG